MGSEKISAPLAERLEHPEGDDWLDVVVELGEGPTEEDPHAPRAAKISARKEAFARQAEPVAAKIRSLGGEVTGEAWINATLRARLDRNMIAALSKENRIARIDLPHMLKSDAR
jgi:hypothetical protein